MSRETLDAGRARGEKPVSSGLMALLVLLLFVPFVNKAFHIDDPAFMNMARMISWNPLHAIPMDYDYAGKILPGLLPYEITHPLFVPYFIKIVTYLCGESEIALHLAFLVFPLIAGFSLLKLNRLLGPDGTRNSMLPVLLFFSMPAVLVNGQNLMTDLPTVAFLLLSMACYTEYFTGGSARSCYAGGAILTLAIFTSYQMLAFVPLVGAYALYRRSFDRHVALSLALPILVLSAWLLAVYKLYDIFPLAKSRLDGVNASIRSEISNGLQKENLINKSLATFAFFGASLLWALPLYHLSRRTMGRFLAGLAILTVLCWLLTGALNTHTAMQRVWVALFLALALTAFASFVQEIRRKLTTGEPVVPQLFLLGWVLLVICYVIMLLPFGSVRYILPSLPAALLLLTGDLSVRVSRRPVLQTIILSGSLLFGLASAYADYRFAGVYRDFAGEMAKLRAGNSTNPEIWYSGEWGMNYYMRKAGARYLYDGSNAPRSGDYVVMPEMPLFWGASSALRQRLDFAAKKEYSSSFPLRLFNRRSRAGFYAHFWGLRPFAFSREPDEVFTIFRVVK